MVSKNIKLKGFTIIELLVVIVVIGILAAITIVSFANVTNRGYTASGQAAANNVISKAVLYKNGPTISGGSNGLAGSNYPLKISTLTSLATTDPAYLSGVTSVTTLTAAPGSPYNTVLYRICGLKTITTTPVAATLYTDFSTGGTGADSTFVSTSLITGIVARFWNFQTAGLDDTITDGVVSGTATYNGTGYTVGCVSTGAA